MAGQQGVSIKVSLAGAAAARRDANSTGKAIKGIGTESQIAAKKVNLAERSLHGLRRGFGLLAGAAAGAGIAAFAKSTVQASSDVNESLTKNQVLFGRNAAAVDKFSKTSATAFGISRRSALEYTGVFGNLFTALGITAGNSAKFSVGLTKLAGDMASFNNTSIEDALEAIRSGLVGETEPLRRFGVNLNDATLRQQAMSMGLTKTTKNVLTPYQRSMAAQALIVKQTEKAHGDFKRTSGGLANQQRILAARWDDTKVALGDKLLPAVLKGVTALNKFVTQMQKGTGAGGRFADKVREIGKTIGRDAGKVKTALSPLLDFIGDHKKGVAEFAAGLAGIGLALKTVKGVGRLTGAGKVIGKLGKYGGATPVYVVNWGGKLEKTSLPKKVLGAAKKYGPGGALAADFAAGTGTAGLAGTGAAAALPLAGILGLALTHNYDLPTRGQPGASSPSNPAGHVTFDQGAPFRRVITPVNPAALMPPENQASKAGNAILNGGANPFVIHTTLRVDGKELARAVTHAANKKSALK